MKVLVVCDGNICRSPLAAEYLRDRASRSGLAHLIVASGGLLGIEGRPAAPFALAVASEAGLDLSRHRSRGISEADLRTCDVVLGMTLAHLEALARRAPGLAAPAFLIRAFEHGPEPRGGAPNLEDPVTGPIEGFREAFGIIRASIDHVVLWLKHHV